MYRVIIRTGDIFGDEPHVCEFLCDTSDDVATLPTSVKEGTGGKSKYDNQKCSAGSSATIATSSGSNRYILNNCDEWIAQNSGSSNGNIVPIDKFVMDNITGYFDPNTIDIENSKWNNSISGKNDITFTVNTISKEDNALKITRGSYGEWLSEINDVWYIVINIPTGDGKCVMGEMCKSNLGRGYELSMYSASASYGYAIEISLGGSPYAHFGSRYGYHLITLIHENPVDGNNENISVYYDGILQTILTGRHTTNYNGGISFGKRMAGDEYPYEKVSDAFIRFMAFGTNVSRSIIENNNEWIMKHYCN